MTQTPDNTHDEAIKKPLEAGNYLKSVRLQKNLTEDDIFKSLRIKARIINAIENHHYAHLPDAVTVVALVRQYANFLGLDGTEVGNNYKKEMVGIEPKIEIIFPDKLPTSFKPFKQSLLFTVVMLGIYFCWRLLNNTDNLLPQIIPHDAPYDTQVTTTETKEVVSSLTSQTTIQNNPLQSTADSAEKVGKTVSQEITPVLHFKIVKNPEIFIKAISGESWIEVKNINSRQIIFSGILRKGQNYKVPFDIKGLRLKAGNTAPLSITVNDASLPILPKNNRVLRDFNIDSDNILKLYNEYQSTVVVQ